MNNLFLKIKQRVQRHQPSIVFPESLDHRVLEAVSYLSNENILTPILIGNEERITAELNQLRIKLKKWIVYDPGSFPGLHKWASALVERRKGQISAEAAYRYLLDENNFGTMLVFMGEADGLVSGAAHTTAQTVKPALQIIQTEKHIKKVSGAFLMVKGRRKLLFADCAINVSPSAEDLAEIAILSAETAHLFDITPKVAMLSFSTKGSARGPEVEKVTKATQLAKEQSPDLILDGEFQFDAAFVPDISAKKAPGSPLKGEANVFIFPNIEAGNIGYKLVQRLAGFEAIGPILQGLNQPVNDLSRGCSTEDIYKLSLITAMQSLNKPLRKEVLRD